MSAATATAIKAHIETLGLGLAAYRDLAPTEKADGSPMTPPYVTVHEGISITPDRHGSPSDPNAHISVTELVQVDLWQVWRTNAATSSGAAESYPLPDQLYNGLHGASLTTAPKHVYGCTVDGSVRTVEADENLVHHAYTVRLRRNL